jgi:hypothetical protein
LNEPKLDVHGELIAFNKNRVAVTRVGGIEWAMWDLTKQFLPESAERGGARRINSSHPPHFSAPSQNFKEQPVKSAVLASDQLILGLAKHKGPAEPSKPGQPLQSRAELRIYGPDGSMVAEVPLETGTINCGIAAADGRLYISCEDGSLMCVGE